MTSWLESDAVRVGTDPDDGTWIDARPEHWMHATHQDTDYDPTRNVVELAVVLSEEREPLGEHIVALDGTEYWADPAEHLIWTRDPCDDAASRVRGIGGYGSSLGQLAFPYGLAIDCRGLLYIADSGNHRVILFDAQAHRIEHVLGMRDLFGGFVAGDHHGAMREPVDVAVHASGLVAVADREAGKIHIFHPDLRYARSFAALPLEHPATFVPRPIAVAFEPEGTLLVADARWPRLLRLSLQGRPLGDVSLRSTTLSRFAGLTLASEFVLEGSVVVGPFDSRRAQVLWHTVELGAELPDGCALSIQTYASDQSTLDATLFAPSAPVAIPSPCDQPTPGRFERLVLAHPTAERSGIALHTDRGRYLYVRIAMQGAPSEAGTTATATPSLHRLRVQFPRHAQIELLPAVFRQRDAEDPRGSLFLERYLALLTGVLQRIERKYEEHSSLINIDAAQGEWLDWLGRLLGLTSDPSWDDERKRSLFREAVSLFQRRGTPWAISRYLAIYTGREPVIQEDMFAPHAPQQVLGAGVLGTSRIGERGLEDAPRGPHRFKVRVYADDTDQRDDLEPVVRRILEAEKPAHTAYDLVWVLPDARLGETSTIGIDFVLGAPPMMVLGPPLDDGASSPLVLGSGPPLGARRSTSAPTTPDRDLVLE